MKGIASIVFMQSERKKGIFWNSLGSTIYGVNSFLMLTVVGRICSVEETGGFGIAFTTAQLMYIVGLLGVNHYQQTDYMEKYKFFSYLSVKFFSTLLMFVGVAFIINIFQFSSSKVAYTIVLTILMALNSIGEMIQSLFFQKNRLDLSGKCLFDRTFWSLLIFIIASILFKNIIVSLWLQIFTNFLITLVYAYKYIPVFVGTVDINVKCLIKSGTSLLIECIPLFISTFLMNTIINTSKYGIELFMDDVAQGYYNLIFMPAQVINLLSLFVFKPLLNDYANEIYVNNYLKVKKMLFKQMYFIVLFTFICMVGAYIIGTQVLGFIFNKNLTEQRISLVLIVLAGGIFALCQLLYYILVILRRQKSIMRIYILGAFVAIFTTYIGVRRWGTKGAAFSFVVTEFLIFIIYMLVLHKLYNQRELGNESN